MKDTTAYNQIDLGVRLAGESGSDLAVMRMALDRYARRAPRISDVLAAGPLSVSDEEKREFLGVFTRGLQEVRVLLGA